MVYGFGMTTKTPSYIEKDDITASIIQFSNIDNKAFFLLFMESHCKLLSKSNTFLLKTPFTNILLANSFPISSSCTEIFAETSMDERKELADTIEETFTTDCPFDFLFKYDYAKTAADTYALEEVIEQELCLEEYLNLVSVKKESLP